MESDDDFQLFSSPEEEASSPVCERKLKRLKKAVRVSQDSHLDQSDGDPLTPEANSLKFGSQDVQESDELQSRSGSKDFSVENNMDSSFTGLGGDEDGSGARRALDFEDPGDELDENGEDRKKEIQGENGDVIMEDKKGEDRKKEIQEESGYASMEELDKKRRSPDDLGEKKNKKKKKTEDRESAATKRRMEKERRENMKQLRVESQRLLRESSVAAFKPTPLVQKPISSVLEKIRQRKLEISKKSIIVSSTTFIEEDNLGSTREILEDHIIGVHVDGRGDDKISKATIEEAIQCPTEAENNIDGLCIDGSSDIITNSSFGGVPSEMAVDEESKQEFRAPIDDTQDLFSDSQTSDMKDTPSSPLEEVFAPSILAMSLKLDSAPPDDDSSDEEDNDKENLDPHPHGLADLSLSPNDDLVKAFVDDEAEEEDDSDNDLLQFQDNEDEDDGDAEELNDMIATGYEEQPMDNENRNELHQKWLEQQDAAGTENLLQKLKCGSKLRETTLLEEEVAEGEEDEEFGYGVAEDLVPANIVRMNLCKVRQMIPQMFSENDNAYLSDEEETEKRLTKQCLLGKAEKGTSFLSPAEDESSREIFALIKKLNAVPNTTKKAKKPSYFDMPLMGGNRNMKSKSSFLGRGSNHCLPSYKKRGSGTARSFIFNEMIATAEAQCQSRPEDSSETIEKQNRPRTASVKFSGSQTRTSSQKSTTAAMEQTTSLLDILRKTSLKSKHCTRDNTVSQTESVLASFKLAKKPMKAKEDSTVYIKS